MVTIGVDDFFSKTWLANQTRVTYFLFRNQEWSKQVVIFAHVLGPAAWHQTGSRVEHFEGPRVQEVSWNSTVSHKKLQSEVKHGNKDETNTTHTFFWTSLVLFSKAPFSSHGKTKITTTSTTKHQVVFVAGGRWSIRVVTPRSGSSTRPTWRQIGACEKNSLKFFLLDDFVCVFVYSVIRWAYRYSAWNI